MFCGVHVLLIIINNLWAWTHWEMDSHSGEKNRRRERNKLRRQRLRQKRSTKILEVAAELDTTREELAQTKMELSDTKVKLVQTRKRALELSIAKSSKPRPAKQRAPHTPVGSRARLSERFDLFSKPTASSGLRSSIRRQLPTWQQSQLTQKITLLDRYSLKNCNGW